MRFKHFIFLILFINILTINIYSEGKDAEDIVKIGVYEYEPYISVDDKGNVSGYYDDFVDLLDKKYKGRYEYVLCNISDGLDKLKNNDIDIMLGIPITIEDSEDIIFNKYSIAQEKFGIFNNEDIDLDELKKIGKVKIGIVEDDYNSFWVLDFLDSMNIDATVIYDKNYKSLEALMKEDKIDLMVDNLYQKRKYNLIYEFTGNQVYIAGNENSRQILDNIDKVIKEYNDENSNKISELYSRYFNEKHNEKLYIDIAIYILFVIACIAIVGVAIVPERKKKNIKNNIKNRMNNDKYILQYQPIYNPRNGSIVGFEGLLRLLGEDNKLIPPFKFIPEIENNNMLFDISLWILKKGIKDYNIIKSYDNMNKKDFYISINLSLNEIENDKFVDRAIEILSNSNLGPNKICLEIVERVKMNDINKINKNVNRLRSAGFKIAIDDFGVEYSNLDVLQKLDVDTIKVDKNFVDGIGKDTIKDETILFISRIAKTKNKAVVLEGVEELEQHIEIKKIENDYLYVQGYYYGRPMYIEDIKNI